MLNFRTPYKNMNAGDRPIDVLSYLAATKPKPQNSALPRSPKQIPHSPTNHASQWMRTEIYSSHGEKYYRFRWGKGRQTWGYIHIPGGGASTKIVQARKKAVDKAIGSGQSVDQIKKMVIQWSEAKRGRKAF